MRCCFRKSFVFFEVCNLFAIKLVKKMTGGFFLMLFDSSCVPPVFGASRWHF